MHRWDQYGSPAGLADVGLDRAQHAAAEAVAGTQPLVVVVGPAGTGKTTALLADRPHPLVKDSGCGAGDVVLGFQQPEGDVVGDMGRVR